MNQKKSEKSEGLVIKGDRHFLKTFKAKKYFSIILSGIIIR